jgi:serine protease
MLRALRHPLSVFPCVVALAACGGGGGSGGGSGPAPPAAANRVPTAAFTADPISGGSPLTVAFDGSSSSDADGSIASYTWTFGDGSATATGATISHTYQAGSTGARYTARLTVRDNVGATAIKDAEIRVGPPDGSFALTGTVQILSSSAIDSDVNDPTTTSVANDGFDTAQAVTNPVTLGGYLTRAGRGADGALRAAGDVADFFRVSLAGNETILVTIGEPEPDAAADDPTLSMQLWQQQANGSRVLRDSVPSISESASLTSPGPGDYYIELDIGTGATTYVLSVGQTAPAAANVTAQPPRVSDDFVPGEFILVGPESTPLPDGFETAAGEGELRLVDMRTAMAARGALASMAGWRDGGRLSKRHADKFETLAAIAAIRARARVRAVEPNYVRRALRTPDDPYFRYQWHYQNVNLPLAWDITQGSSQIVVAVVDTGILPDHPDIAGQLVPGYDFIRSVPSARDGNGIDNDPTDPGDLAYGASSSFHGTHVAGTVAAQSNDGEGVAGVAWNAKIMPLRALGQDGGTSYDVIQAVRWAAGLSNDSGTLPAKRADIINLSLGSGGSSSAEQALVDTVRAAGVIVVAAAGNDASAVPFYPASYNGVVSVSATTIDRLRAAYSNFGAGVDVAAPGGSATDRNGDGVADGVLSTIADDSGSAMSFGYATLSGTSMAAPHVAGVVALMKSVYGALTPEQFDTSLSQGLLTTDLGAPGRDNDFGHGQIDAQKAVIRALELANAGGAPTSPILVGTPSSVNFGTSDTTVDVQLRNAGGGSITIVDRSTTAAWLRITPVAIGATGLGTYRLTADRSQVGTQEGTFSAQAVFESDITGGSPFVVSAVMQRLAVNPLANAGRHYVVVFHPETGTTVNGVAVNAANGAYAFSIPNVGMGDYQIFAGTDSDNDNFLCDGGEACGAFRVLELPETITVTGSRSGIDFVSGFRANLFHTGTNAAATDVALPAAGIPIPPSIARTPQ